MLSQIPANLGLKANIYVVCMSTSVKDVGVTPETSWKSTQTLHACFRMQGGFYQPEKRRKNKSTHQLQIYSHLHGGATYDMFTVKILQHDLAGIDDTDKR